MTRRACFIATLLLLLCANALADGKMFWPREAAPTIPYQRAVVHFKDGVETLLLQSGYSLPLEDDEETEPVGWVVPVPVVPELASASADEAAYSVFAILDGASRPSVIQIIGVVLEVLFYLSASAFVVGLLLLIVLVYSGFYETRPKWRVANGCLVILAPLLALFALLIAGSTRYASPDATASVEVLDERQVGAYHARVIRGDDANDLIAWLNENTFKYNESDKAAFDSYIARGWCFVVAVLNASEEQEPWELSSEEWAAPLIMRFPREAPVYPVALTATGGHDTEILIHLGSDRKFTCDGRLAMRYAGEREGGFVALSNLATSPEAFFTPANSAFTYLTTFKSTLAPEQMREDIVFIPAQDNEPYRERHIRW